MNSEVEFYICPVCFMTAGAPRSHHRRRMIHYSPLPAGHDLLKPPLREGGQLGARAPRWFLEGMRARHGRR